MELRRIEDLTENDVKKVGRQFIKSYYRNRPRDGQAILEVDMRGQGGIIADGMLQFPKPEQEGGGNFIATFEATSYDTRHEVYYTKQKGLIRWDAAAISSTLVALAFMYLYLQDYWLVRNYADIFYHFVWLLLVWFVFGFLITLVIGRFRRYRYIYAIEQFKKYHADEQWVVIGEDVFISMKDDAYYQELKKQCIHNGFGLLVVNKDHTYLKVVTPALTRLDKKERRIVEFISQNELTRRIQEGLPGDWMKKWMNRSWDGFVPGDSLSQLNRFRKSYQFQLGFCTLALALVILILVREYRERPVIYYDQEAYVEEIMRFNAKLQGREPNNYILDTPYFYPLPLLIDTRDIPNILSLQLQEETENKNVNTQAEADGTPLISTESDILVTTEQPRKKVTYDCSRFYNITRNKYMILEGYYDTFEEVNTKVSQFNALGLTANALWMGCFYKAESGYAIYFNTLYNTTDEAGLEAEDLASELARKNMEIKLSIILLSPEDVAAFKN